MAIRQVLLYAYGGRKKLRMKTRKKLRAVRLFTTEKLEVILVQFSDRV